MKLAIIIPAYKTNFFRETLRSIENQTCKDFHLYIGDDNSPHDLESIVKSTLKTVDYTYKKFPDNLGSTDLVAQWERCIDMKNNEEWIWLFSDDDVMSPECVFYFLKRINTIDSKIIRFNKILINQHGEILRTQNLPKILFFQEFISQMFLGNTSFTIPEFIFSRKLYDSIPFVNFPLAWGSDVATWLKYVYAEGKLHSINDASVLMRMSDTHLSSLKTTGYMKYKLQADVDFLYWLKIFIHDVKISEPLRKNVFEHAVLRKLCSIKQNNQLNMKELLRTLLFMATNFSFKKSVREILSTTKFYAKNSLFL